MEVLVYKTRVGKRSVMTILFVTLIFLILIGFPEYATSISIANPNYFYTAIALVAVIEVLLASRASSFKPLLVDKKVLNFGYLMALLFILFCASWFYSSQSDLSFALLRARFWSVVTGIGFAWVFYRFGLPVRTIIFAILFMFVVNISDFLTPTFSTVPGRAAGFHLNPTITGQVIVLCFAAIFSAVSKSTRILVGGLVLVSVLLTFSRSSFVALALFFLYYFATTASTDKGRKALHILIGASLVAVIFWLISSGILAALLQSTLSSDLLTENTLNRIGGRDHLISDHSATERKHLAIYALNYIQDFSGLIFGRGLAASHEWAQTESTHNMYLLLLSEQGAIGLLAYLSLFMYLYVGAAEPGKSLIILLMCYSFFTHNILDAPAQGSIFLAMAAVSRAPRKQRYPVSWSRLNQA